MKLKTSALIIGFFTLLISAGAHAAPADWYVYHGTAGNHSFTLRFPPGWTAHSIGENVQGFSPTETSAPIFRMEEFANKTHQEVINSLLDNNTELLSQTDEILQSSPEDFVIKKLQLKKLDTATEYGVILLKRGNYIFSLTADHPTYNNEVQEIYNSLQFTDGWLQYIDYAEGYTFIFPDHFEVSHLPDGVEILVPADDLRFIFNVKKYLNTNIADAAEQIVNNYQTLDRTDLISFHGIENVVEAIYTNTRENKSFSRLLIAHNGHVYSLSNTNLQENYPSLDLYAPYVQEILESFEFFQLENPPEGITAVVPGAYEHFPDVLDDHLNSKAINSLATLDIIAGYEDGLFQPDGLVNRAELTKVLVTAKDVEPNALQYANCFEDVTDEWYAPHVCYAKEQGWIAGYEDNTFRPSESVTRAEALKIIFETLFEGQFPDNLKLTDPRMLDIPADAWFRNYLALGVQLDLLDMQHTQDLGEAGYKYLAGETITRKEVAETIYRSGRYL